LKGSVLGLSDYDSPGPISWPGLLPVDDPCFVVDAADGSRRRRSDGGRRGCRGKGRRSSEIVLF